MKKYLKGLLTSLIIVMLLGNVALAKEEYVITSGEPTSFETELSDEEYVVSDEVTEYTDEASEDEYELPLDEVTGYGVELTEEEQASYEASLVNDASSEDEYELLGAGIPTEEEAYQIMMSYMSSYPEGMTYTNDNYYGPFKGGLFSGGFGCAGFAFMLSDAVFDSLPARKVDNMPFGDVHAGDILRINNNGHSVIVLKNCGTYLILAEANYNSSVHWGRIYTASEYAANLTYVMTRYPVGYFDASPTCSIAFDANGGSGAPETMVVDKNVSVEIPDTIPTKAFCTFLGWSVQPAATKADYLAGRSYSFTGNTALYAVWKYNYETISGALPLNIDLALGASGKLYKYTATESGSYVLKVNGTGQIKWTFQNENMQGLGYQGSSSSSYSQITVTMTSGNTYYIGVERKDTVISDLNVTFSISKITQSIPENVMLQYYDTYQVGLALYETKKIGFNFYVVIPDKLTLSKTKYSFSCDGKDLGTYRFYSYQSVESGYFDTSYGPLDVNLYKVTCYVPITSLADDVTLKLYYNNGLISEDTYSVVEYAEMNIADPNVNPKEKVLMKKLLNYGAFSQMYFGRNTDKLANSILEESDKVLNCERDLGDFKYKIFDLCDDVDYLGSSLVLQSDFTVRHYFKVESKSDFEGATITANGANRIPTWISDNVFYIDVFNIDISGIKNLHEVIITSPSGQKLTLWYSVMSYFERALDRKNDKDDLSNLVYSVLDYEEAFNNLFK